VSRRSDHRRCAGLRTRLALLGSALALGVAILACWSNVPGGSNTPNVILISIDSLRPDHLGCYGYPRGTSPHLDALAAEGVVFESAASTSSWTLPAHVSLLSGLYPEVHGVNRNHRRLGEEAPLLAERLNAAGYSTRAVVSAPYLERRFGYARGFEIYDDQTVAFESHEKSHEAVTSPRLHARALELLDSRPEGRPFFLFLHYWDVHYDYRPPEPFRSRFAAEDVLPSASALLHGRQGQAISQATLDALIDLYDGEISWVDHHLGRLFDALRERDLFDDTIIIVTSDHGDEFLEHGLLFHRWNLYETTLRVPLIVKLPAGHHRGTRVASPVGLVDVAPTVLSLLELEVPLAMNGRSLEPLLEDPGARVDTAYFAELQGWEKSLRLGRWKLMLRRSDDGEQQELFDLGADPAERTDRSSSEPDMLERLLDLHGDWLVEAERQRETLEGSTIEYDEALEAALESLGYLE